MLVRRKAEAWRKRRLRFLKLEAEIEQDRWAAPSGVKCGEAMLQVFIEGDGHAEAKRLTERQERALIEAVKPSVWNRSRVAAVRLA
jgi:hypothetical protein